MLVHGRSNSSSNTPPGRKSNGNTSSWSQGFAIRVDSIKIGICLELVTNCMAIVMVVLQLQHGSRASPSDLVELQLHA